MRQNGTGNIERVQHLAGARGFVAHGAMSVTHLTQSGAFEGGRSEESGRKTGLASRRGNGEVIVVQEEVIERLYVTET